MRTVLLAALVAASLGLAHAQAPAAPPKPPHAQPSLSDSLVMRAAHRLQRGDANGALMDINAVIAREPGNSAAYALRGTIRMTTGDRPNAVHDFSRAIELTPEVKGMEVVYVNRANVLWLDGRPKQAQADLAKALSMNPDFALAYNLRGRMKADAGDLDGAIADFDLAIKLEPKMMPAYVARAAVNLQAGRLEQSISDYKTLMWVLPQDADIVASHGIVRGLMGETGPAIRDLMKALLMNPRSVSTEERGGPQSPARRLDLFVEMNPNEARGYLMRGTLLALNGEQQRANREFSRAIELDPKMRGEVEAVRNAMVAPVETK